MELSSILFLFEDMTCYTAFEKQPHRNRKHHCFHRNERTAEGKDMIRKQKPEDIEDVRRIVNDSWASVYQGYVNPLLLTEDGVRERTRSLKEDFQSRRLSEFVYTENNHVAGMLSFGPTADSDRRDAFEIWRIYVSSESLRLGIGSQLLRFAEEAAIAQGYAEIVIWAFRKNAHALSFYRKHGYTEDREEYLGEPYLADAMRMIKKTDMADSHKEKEDAI